MNLSQRARFIDGSQKYKFYNYLQSDGTAYIDMGLAPTFDTKVEVKFNTPSPSSWIFGSRVSSVDANKFAVAFNATAYYLQFASSPGSNTGNYLNADTVVELSKGGGYVNGVLKASYSDVSLTSSLNLFLFRLNQAGNPYGEVAKKIYYCKIYESGILVRDFIPVKRRSDGMLGMLDKVNNVFYTNAAGSGSFTIG